jgi:hypothetical protein
MSRIGQQCRQANESGNGLIDDICGTASHKMDTQDTGQWSSGGVKGNAVAYVAGPQSKNCCGQSKQTFDSGGEQIPHDKLSFGGRYWRYKRKVRAGIEWKLECNQQL